MAPLTRIHSILKHSVSMRDADIDMIVATIDAILTDLSKQPQLQPCVLPDGWIPIASLLNYTHLGQSVWPFGGVGVVADCLAARSSAVSELSSDSACVRNKPLRVRLRQQLEYIFSDVNYHKDIHLHLLAEPDGYTPMHLLFSTYTQLQQLMQQVQAPSAAALEAQQQQVVREALETSSELVVRPPQPGNAAAPFGAARRRTLPERVVQQVRGRRAAGRHPNNSPMAARRGSRLVGLLTPRRPACLPDPGSAAASWQVEWYLSRNKVATDRFLAELSKDHDGWVPIASLLSFPRSTPPLPLVLHAAPASGDRRAASFGAACGVSPASSDRGVCTEPRPESASPPESAACSRVSRPALGAVRKLCHPQIAAVAHVLGSSDKVDVSDDQTLVRPRSAPHSSPAGSAAALLGGGMGGGARGGAGGRAAALLLAALERLLSDASLCFDAALQRRYCRPLWSPNAATRRSALCTAASAQPHLILTRLRVCCAGAASSSTRRPRRSSAAASGCGCRSRTCSLTTRWPS